MTTRARQPQAGQGKTSTTGLLVGIPRGLGRYEEAAQQGRLWTPAELRGSGQLIVWYDFSDLSTLTLSTTVLTAVTDKSGRGFTGTTPGNDPNYTYPGIDTVAVANGYIQPAPNLASGLYDLAFVAKTRAGATYRVGIHTSGSHAYILNTTTTNIGVYDGGGFKQAGSLAWPTGTLGQSWCSIRSGSNVQFGLNGSNPLVSPAAHTITTTPTPWWFADAGTGGRGLGSIYECVAMSAGLPDHLRWMVEGYLAWKWSRRVVHENVSGLTFAYDDLVARLPASHPYKWFPPTIGATALRERMPLVPVFPSVGATITADAGSYTYTGTDASLLEARKLDGTTPGAYAYTGTDATPFKTTLGAFVIIADPGAYALTGTDATLTKTTNKALAADLGVYALSGTDVTLTKGSNNKALTADPGIYILTGTAVAFLPPFVPAIPLRGEWPIKKRKRQPEYHAALRARDALREALERLYDGGDYNAPIEALEEAQGEAQSVVNVLTRLPDVPVAQLRAAEELMRQIAEIIRLRLLDEAQTEAATEIARLHLNETIDLATALYRRTRYDYLARVALLTVE